MTAIRNIQQTIVTSAAINQKLWTVWFGQAWDSLRFHEKLTWLLFISYTVSILTMLEILILG